MKRQYRTLIVMVVAVATAALASFAVYRAVQRMPVREVEVANMHVVVAAAGAAGRHPPDREALKVVAWPSRNPVAGAFSEVTPLVDRGVIVADRRERAGDHSQSRAARGRRGPAADHPDRHARDFGAGQRSHRRRRLRRARHARRRGRHGATDTGRRRADDAHRRQQRAGADRRHASSTRRRRKDGKPIPTSVVTLLVLPEDAERIALASNEGKIMLALRNPLDVEPTETQGHPHGGADAPAPARSRSSTEPTSVVPSAVAARRRRRRRRRRRSEIYTVETIRAAKRSGRGRSMNMRCSPFASCCRGAAAVVAGALLACRRQPPARQQPAADRRASVLR